MGTYVPKKSYPGRRAIDCRACPYGKRTVLWLATDNHFAGVLDIGIIFLIIIITIIIIIIIVIIKSA